MKQNNYQGIDTAATEQRIEELRIKKSLSARDIKKYLGLTSAGKSKNKKGLI